MTVVIFVSGKVAAGKDTVVSLLCQDLLIRESVSKIPFAWGVRDELCLKYPEIDRARLETDYKYKAQFRKEMVEIGDGYRKTISPSIWVDHHRKNLMREIEKNPKKIICTTDLRYSTNDSGDEFQYSKDISKQLGIVTIRVRVKAPLLVRLSRMSPENVRDYLMYSAQNDSECSLDHLPDEAFDYVFNNGIPHAEPKGVDIFREDLLTLWSRQ